MITKNTISTQSVQDLRQAVAGSFDSSGDVLLNIIDALVVGPAPGSPVDLNGSPVFAYGYSSLYQALRRATEALGPDIEADDWLRRLRQARLDWLAAQPPEPLRPDLGAWKIRILDATNHYRPQVRTVPLSYVHGADGMKPGIGLSVLAERVGAGSWTLPLEIGWMPAAGGPTIYGAAQIKAFVAANGWPADYVLDVDSQYTVRPFLTPVVAAGVNVLGRVRQNRVFYLPVLTYEGCGRPAQLGAKFSLRDPATHPPADWQEEWSLAQGGRVAARGWRDVRQKGWAAQPLTLYQIVEYRADGRPRYKRPLWLLFVAGKPATPLPAAQPAPTPREAEALYDERFSIEHMIRFEKQALGLVNGQFNGSAAEGREQTWVELVATAHWMLWALRGLVEGEAVGLPAWWRSRKLMPGAMRRLAGALFAGLEWRKPEVKPRGKSPGRAEGETQEPRPRFKVHRAGGK